MLLLITSTILVLLGLASIFLRGSLWAAHVSRNEKLGRAVGDEAKWKRNLLIGGVVLLAAGVLGYVVFLLPVPGV